jgi:hypothetical protein
MPIKKSEKIVRIVFVVILLLLLTQNACVQASWARFRIRRGMTVNEVLQASGDWTWGHAYSPRPAPDQGVALSFNPRLIHFPGKDEPEQVASRQDLAHVLETQMKGHPWSMSLTYLGALRASFAVFFDAQGKTQSVSGISGPP